MDVLREGLKAQLNCIDVYKHQEVLGQLIDSLPYVYLDQLQAIINEMP